MRARALVLCLGLALLVTSFPLFAQLPTGTVTGRVTSAEGEALPGVTVTVSSPSLQGTRTATTSETGDYNIPFLPAGEYEVSFELEGFSDPRQTVKISAAQTARVDADLTTASVSEEIVVTGTYETISTDPQAATTFEKEFVESLPVERNIRETVLLTPGVSANGPGGNSRARGISISGSQSYENLFLVNGVVVNENLRGQPYDLFIEDAIEETTTTVSGISAEYGRFSGGVVNTITKSGGNEVHGSLRTAFTNQDWEQPTPITTQQVDKINQRYEATLGGFLWRDKVWYFLAGRDFEREETEQTFVTRLPFQEVNDQQRYEGKITLSPFQGHRLVGSYIEVEEAETGNRFGDVMDIASLYERTLPQDLRAINYTGVITENFFVEAQYSERHFTFEGSGSRFRDRIFGTLMVDGATNRRFWSPTFCGVCTPEQRDNENMLVKGSWFLSTDSVGSHDVSFGYDSFDDIRLANNHQSGSDFRIIARSTFEKDGQIYLTMTPDAEGRLGQYIQYNPILKFTEGTSFVTNSYFLNDKWRLNDHWSFNVGVRFDENDGEDAEGQKVASDSRISPRVSAAWDPKADGDWVFNASYGEYVAAIANNQANATTSAGNSATIRWHYRGPAINPDGVNSATLVDTETALRQIFDWFDSQGGINNTSNNRLYSIPGGTQKILGSLESPYAREYSVGAAKRLGNRGLVRADYVHRDYEAFYGSRIDLVTGQVTTPNNTQADLSLLGNDDGNAERVYDGLHSQVQYRFTDKFNLGATYTLSHLRGNFDGETTANGPVATDITEYPEYKERSWNTPRGSLDIDQRHRLRAWAVYDIFQTDHHSLNIGLLQNFATGVPYGAEGRVASSRYVTNPGYAQPPATVTYWYTNRDGFRTADITATDITLNYAFQWSLFGKSMEVFLQPEVLNIFDEDGVFEVADSVLDATTTPACPPANRACKPGDYKPGDAGFNPNGLYPFNPFTETPVEGVHWRKADNFGEAQIPDDYQAPRTFRFSVGFRF